MKPPGVKSCPWDPRGRIFAAVDRGMFEKDALRALEVCLSDAEALGETPPGGGSMAKAVMLLRSHRRAFSGKPPPEELRALLD